MIDGSFFSCAGLSVHDGNANAAALLKTSFHGLTGHASHPRCSRGPLSARQNHWRLVRAWMSATSISNHFNSICFRVHAGKDPTIMGGFKLAVMGEYDRIC